MARQLLTDPPQPNQMENKMSEKWTLQEGVKMDDATAGEVARIACALKSLSAYTSMAMESEDAPEDLQVIVDEGLEAMARIFVW
jgi:hypothetical protein